LEEPMTRHSKVWSHFSQWYSKMGMSKDLLGSSKLEAGSSKG